MNPDYVVIYRSRLSRPSQRWRWRRVAPNGRVIASSAEGYRDRDHCHTMAVRCTTSAKVKAST